MKLASLLSIGFLACSLSFSALATAPAPICDNPTIPASCKNAKHEPLCGGQIPGQTQKAVCPESYTVTCQTDGSVVCIQKPTCTGQGERPLCNNMKHKGSAMCTLKKDAAHAKCGNADAICDANGKAICPTP